MELVEPYPVFSIRAKKWRYLCLGSKWDRCVVPIYEATARGKRTLLLKTLLTDRCQNDCLYCALRSHRRGPRYSWDPSKLIRIALELWAERKIDGLFLSSGLFKDPDYTVEREVEVVRGLRDAGYTGYIHLRLMPGVSRYLAKEAIRLVDRVGVNLEAPSREIFSALCPDKGDYENDVVKRLRWLSREAESVRPERHACGYASAGLDTQLIVGATEDSDVEYLMTLGYLYNSLGLRRVYFSGFEPISETPLANRKPCPKRRVATLYKASYLIRDYGFTTHELLELTDDRGLLPPDDPKVVYARLHPELFPVDPSEAGFKELVRIPGIGPSRANKIIEARKGGRVDRASSLAKLLGKRTVRKIAPYVELRGRLVWG
ncbi:TPA: radical SAM protein [Candidatus Bathyarchaeota archaeon]|nr:radical SAM protein [Candidatus Bathyarchaeota archaeon]